MQVRTSALNHSTPPRRAGGPCEEGGRARVLVVEDNPVNGIVIEAQLEQLGLDSEIAPNGERALERLDDGGWDLVLMDCMLPGLSGYAVTQAWRATEQRRALRRLPIVALTANVADGHEAQCLAAGMDGYLTKPCSLPALAAMLGRWLPALRAK